MKYVYKTKGTCSTLIELELEGNIVHNVKFTGGCNGNLQAIPKLVEGLTVEQVEQKIGGISCNGRGTSCVSRFTFSTLLKILPSTYWLTSFNFLISSLISTRFERFSSLLQVVQVSVNLHAHWIK